MLRTSPDFERLMQRRLDAASTVTAKVSLSVCRQALRAEPRFQESYLVQAWLTIVEQEVRWLHRELSPRQKQNLIQRQLAELRRYKVVVVATKPVATKPVATSKRKLK